MLRLPIYYGLFSFFAPTPDKCGATPSRSHLFSSSGSRAGATRRIICSGTKRFKVVYYLLRYLAVWHKKLGESSSKILLFALSSIEQSKLEVQKVFYSVLSVPLPLFCRIMVYRGVQLNKNKLSIDGAIVQNDRNTTS